MSSPGRPRTDRRPLPARRGAGPRGALSGPFLVVLATALLAPPGHAGEVSGAILTLEATSAATKDQVAAALPLRFVLLSDGQVFVGGTSRFLAGRLSKDEVAALERRAGEVRKLSALGGSASFGPGPQGFRLGLHKGKPMDVLVEGDPANAPPALLPLSRLVADLAHFDHPSLVPYEPGSYALAVREGKLGGGCRAWTLPLPLVEALAGPRVVPAAIVSGWPTGATPAAVCAEDKTYVVTLRPLVPGE